MRGHVRSGCTLGRRATFGVALAACLTTASCLSPRAPDFDPATFYYPDDYGWDWVDPDAAGFDAEKLQVAIDFAIENESAMKRDLEDELEERFTDDPYGELIGPLRRRGAPNGVILRHGYRVAEWGDTERADVTFSVTKSFLSTVAGLAWDRGMIEDLTDPIDPYMPDSVDLFGSPRNSRITWEMLLQQRSEWEGTLWGKPDVADRRRGRDRRLRDPGSFWEYNDVRVNAAALALLHLWRFPLPQVLDQLIMEPIGATATWEWHGYESSYVEIDGERVQSVSGGGHWGGGLWMSTLDMARFGYLLLRDGVWAGESLLSSSWIRLATSPTEIRPDYGYMWWLNTDRRTFPSAPESSFFARGGGSNIIWIDPDHDMVLVARWIDGAKIDELLGLVLAAFIEE